MELTADQKGNIAEAAIAYTALRLGIDVYRPVGEGGRYDLVFGVDDRLIRVQCKWVPRHGDVLCVRCYSSRRNRDGLLRRLYERGEIDALAAYCDELEKCYFLPLELFEGQAEISLRLLPTKNNQRSRINWASTYEFEARLAGTGP